MMLLWTDQQYIRSALTYVIPLIYVMIPLIYVMIPIIYHGLSWFIIKLYHDR